MKKLISIALIFFTLGVCSSFAQFRPNRFTTNGDPGAWVFIPLPQLVAHDNGTNYVIDWNTNAYTCYATNPIYFVGSTNWGLPGTNRFASVYFPPTNTYRHVYFTGTATNWHQQTRSIVGIPTGFGATIKFQEFGSGETNVTYLPEIDARPTGTNWHGQFDPTSIGGLKLWIEPTQGLFQDCYSNTPAIDGDTVRFVQDLSGFIPFGLTNVDTTTTLFYRGPNNSPGNIPALNFQPLGNPAVMSKTFTALAQPNWCFMMFRGRGKSLVFLDGSHEGNRFACFPSESQDYVVQIYSGTSFNMTGNGGPGIEWKLFSFKQNSTTSLIRTNGVQASSGNSGTQTPDRWTLGSDYNHGQYLGDPAWIAEVLVYNADLTANQITNVESYLWNKYGTPHP